MLQLEKFILKLNAHAIEFIRQNKDGQRQDLAKEFLVKAENALNNTPDITLKGPSGTGTQIGNIKSKLLSITQNNLG